MDINALSPYVRAAWNGHCLPPFVIGKRIILDYEIIYIAEGKWELEILKRKYICKEGDWIFLRPGIEHTIKSIANIEVLQPHIHFDFFYDKNSPDIFVCFNTLEELPEAQRDLLREDIFLNKELPVVFQPKDASAWKDCLYEIIELRKNQNDFNALRIKEKMLCLCRLILLQFNELQQGKNKESYYEMAAVKEYIDNYHLNLSNKRLTLEDIARKFNISKFYVDRLFKKAFGTSIIKYYNQRTVMLAKMYLEKKPTVIEVGDLLGFDTIYLFSRFFKHYTGD